MKSRSCEFQKIGINKNLIIITAGHIDKGFQFAISIRHDWQKMPKNQTVVTVGSSSVLLIRRDGYAPKFWVLRK